MKEKYGSGFFCLPKNVARWRAHPPFGLSKLQLLEQTLGPTNPNPDTSGHVPEEAL